MNTIDLIEIGFSQKPKGIKGYVKLNINERFTSDLKSARAIFFDLNGSQVPFLIEKLIIDHNIFVKLEEVDSPQDAEQYSSKTVYLEKSEVTTSSSEQEFAAHPWLGYEILDQNRVHKGHLVSIEEYPNQLMSFIEMNGHRIMLPLHEDNILNLNDDKMTIQVEIPDGLEDLYKQ